MKVTQVVAPAALVALLSVALLPAVADAQDRGARHRGGDSSGGRSAPRDSGGQRGGGGGGEQRAPHQGGSYGRGGQDGGGASPAPRATPRENVQVAPGGSQGRGGSWSSPSGNADNRGAGDQQRGQYRGNSWGGSPNGGYANGQAVPRDGNRGYENRGGDNRGYVNRGGDYRGNSGYRYGSGYAVPRPGYGPSYRPGYRPGYYGGSSYSYGGYRYRPYYGPSYRPYYHYSNPWYVFRPRFSIGFGVWLGYPVSFPTYGYNPYYSYPGGYVGVNRGYSNYGAVSFDISPYDAELYVDGNFVGQVGNFSGNYPPLTLTPGQHQVEVQAPGYETLVFAVDVVPGQVLPYRGALRQF